MGELEDKGHAHRSLACGECGAVLDRDEAATTCIGYQALYAISNGKVPWEETDWHKQSEGDGGGGMDKGQINKKKRPPPGGGGSGDGRKKSKRLKHGSDDDDEWLPRGWK
jgi:hypothetical protein